MDYSLFLYINNLAGKWICLDAIAIFFAKYLIYFLVAGAILFFFLVSRSLGKGELLKKQERIRYLFLAGISVILSRLVITELIRLFWHRSRPFITHQVNLLLEHSASGSFPSGHMTFLFPLATIIYFFNKKIGIAFFVASFFVGLARIFVGVHYPLDIIGGIIIGFLSAILVKSIIKIKNA